MPGHEVGICYVWNLNKNYKIKNFPGGSVVKHLPSNAWGMGSVSGQGAKILYASRPKEPKHKMKQYCNKVNKDSEKGPHQKYIFLNSSIWYADIFSVGSKGKSDHWITNIPSYCFHTFPCLGINFGGAQFLKVSQHKSQITECIIGDI